MKTTFKQHLMENNSFDFDIEKEVDSYLEIGEIVKPKYESLKSDINHTIYKRAGKYVDTVLLAGDRDVRDNQDWNDVYYGFPRSMLEVLSFRNKLKKFKKDYPNSKVVSDAETFVSQYYSIAEKMKLLKEKIVSVAAKRAEAKKEKEVVLTKKFIDASSLVETLMAFIDEYVENAGKRADEQVDNTWAHMAKSDWDLNVLVPSTSSKSSREDYQHAQARTDWFMSLTDRDLFKKPGHFRMKSAAKKASYITAAKNGAHDSYMAWIHKMIEKIGSKVVKSEMVGNPWNGSRLKVTTEDGEEQVWSTQMIINQSKYSKLFNQFPSRRVK